LSGHVYVW